MADVDLEARLDELFASDAKDFTPTRDALVRDLKAADRADEAADVKALRKPTVAVAAVNRTARERREQMGALVELGEELAALQAEKKPDRDELRDLTRQRRTLLQQLTDHAANTTERPDGARGAIAATLDAASLDEELRGDLQRGRLTQELSPAARFVLGDDATPSPRATPRRSTRSKAAATPPRDELAARRARAELEAARDRAEEAEESVQELTEAATEATERLEAAHRHIADLEAALADARAELNDLKRAERDAQRAERRARTEHERTTAALHAAERAVAESDG
jgi:DNA repair exonuclease SbcCD ATPase subunit